MTNIIQNLLHFLEKSHRYEVGFSPSDKHTHTHTHTHANTQTTYTQFLSTLKWYYVAKKL